MISDEDRLYPQHLQTFVHDDQEFFMVIFSPANLQGGFVDLLPFSLACIELANVG